MIRAITVVSRCALSGRFIRVTSLVVGARYAPHVSELRANFGLRQLPAVIFVNPQTGLAVIQDLKGSFVSGWKLGSEQLRNLLAHGNLGGG